MAQQLSESAKQRIEQALAQYSQWQVKLPLSGKPQLLKRLEGGLSNISMLAEAGSQHFVVRLDGINPPSLGLNRQAEYHIQLTAHASGLAPLPVYFNPELGILVSEFCTQDPPAGEQQELSDIAGLLRKIHALPRAKVRMHPRDRIHRYLTQLGGKPIDPELAELCYQLQNSAVTCLCHNDLLAANRLRNGQQLLAIDWEYAATGDPYFDLAAVCMGDNLDNKASALLLEAYLERAAEPDEQQRLKDYSRIYNYLSRLWEELTTP